MQNFEFSCVLLQAIMGGNRKKAEPNRDVFFSVYTWCTQPETAEVKDDEGNKR